MSRLGQRPSVTKIANTSAESAIHLGPQVDQRVSRAFSAGVQWQSSSWGGAPGCFDRAPVARAKHTFSDSMTAATTRSVC